MSFPDIKILLIGAGKMGGALLTAWLRAGVKPERVTVVETDAAQAEKLSSGGVTIVRSAEEVVIAPDCIVLAVKPQSMDALLPSLIFPPPKGERVSPLTLSIAAGKTLAYFEKHLGDVPVVRAMPNTPALIRKGISALAANKHVSAAQKELATSLLAAAGEVVWLPDESLMDAVTAISGSGPAYVFLFMEALIEAGVSQGLPEEIARKLALYTVRGSVKLAMKSGDSLEQLRKHVTSPGGTTEAALKVLMHDDRFSLLFQEAVATAVRRAKELG